MLVVTLYNFLICNAAMFAISKIKCAKNFEYENSKFPGIKIGFYSIPDTFCFGLLSGRIFKIFKNLESGFWTTDHVCAVTINNVGALCTCGQRRN